MKKMTIKIKGMSCVACSNRLEKQLTSLNGVKKAVVNIATEKATLVYDEIILKNEDIYKRIIDTGFNFEAEYHEKTNNQEKIEKEHRENKLVIIKLLVSVIFGVALFYVSMFPMIFKSELFLPDFFSMKNNPINYSILHFFHHL